LKVWTCRFVFFNIERLANNASIRQYMCSVMLSKI
jgi:hypothetical protein